MARRKLRLKDLRAVARLHRRGMSGPEIARRLGISLRAAYYRLEKAGVTRRRKTAARNRLSERELSRTARLYAQGLSLGKVGARLGMTREGVRYRLEEAGVRRRPRSWPRPRIGMAELKGVAELYATGICATEVARRMGMTAAMVLHRLHKHGVKVRPYSSKIWTPTERARSAAALYQSGLSGPQVAERLVMRRATVYKYLRRQNIPTRRRGGVAGARRRDRLRGGA